MPIRGVPKLSKLGKTIPTIQQVAEQAGVSRATVSRAFGAPNLLKDETVAAVHAVAERLGYVPNHTARALSTGRTGNIALVVPDIVNAFFAALMRGAEGRARQEGYATFLGDSDETPELEDTLLRKLAPQVDGFVLVSSRLPEERIREHAARRPVVLVNRDVADVPRVLIDSGPSYTAGVDLLADLGHCCIAYVAGPELSWSNGQRARAVSDAAERRDVRLLQIATTRPSFEAGQDCVAPLLAGGATAALAFDDVMAQGIVAGMAARGLAVPHDFSVIGCDDVTAERTNPPLTSVSVGCATAGDRAVAVLLEMLGGAAPREPRLVLPTELIPRATTARAPAQHRSQARAACSEAVSPPIATRGIVAAGSQ